LAKTFRLPALTGCMLLPMAVAALKT